MAKRSTSSSKATRGRMTRTGETSLGTVVSDQNPSGIAQASSAATPSTATGGEGNRKRSSTARKSSRKTPAKKNMRTSSGARSVSTPSVGSHREGLTPALAANMSNIASGLWDPRQSVVNNRRSIASQFNKFIDLYTGPSQSS